MFIGYCYSAHIMLSENCRFQVRYGYHWGDVRGEGNGTLLEFYLSAGEYLVGMALHHGWFIDKLRFVTSCGNEFQTEGGEHDYVSQGKELAYFSGQLADLDDRTWISEFYVYFTECA